MKIILAQKKNLHQLKSMYDKIIENMNQQKIEIWDAVYPYEFLKEDIEKGRLYLLTDGCAIVAAFALCEENAGESCIRWRSTKEKALYIDRLGVNADFLRRGFGSLALQFAKEIARHKGAKYLRLFAVDINKPAIKAYLKNGFEQAEGMYEERFDDFVLYEYGFETELEAL